MTIVLIYNKDNYSHHRLNDELQQTQEIEDEPEPLSMAWPDTARKRLTYILVAPLLIPMWLTLPDTRTPKGKKLFPVTFIGSILWIAAFSYLMVWWANVAGDTARIPPEVSYSFCSSLYFLCSFLLALIKQQNQCKSVFRSWV